MEADAQAISTGNPLPCQSREQRCSLAVPSKVTVSVPLPRTVPTTPTDRRNSLATHGRTIHWVRSRLPRCKTKDRETSRLRRGVGQSVQISHRSARGYAWGYAGRYRIPLRIRIRSISNCEQMQWLGGIASELLPAPTSILRPPRVGV
jgi:hypothetical protein